jgi:hypothetical protein
MIYWWVVKDQIRDEGVNVVPWQILDHSPHFRGQWHNWCIFSSLMVGSEAGRPNSQCFEIRHISMVFRSTPRNLCFRQMTEWEPMGGEGRRMLLGQTIWIGWFTELHGLILHYNDTSVSTATTQYLNYQNQFQQQTYLWCGGGGRYEERVFTFGRRDFTLK